MEQLGPDKITTKQLAKRWNMKPKTVRKIAKMNPTVLRPTKPGRGLLFDPADIKQFENQRRIKHECI